MYARNSSFTYKSRAVDVKQVARDSLHVIGLDRRVRSHFARSGRAGR